MSIQTVFIFKNGMMAVCDEHGQQMPEFGGRFLDHINDVVKLLDDKEISMESALVFEVVGDKSNAT